MPVIKLKVETTILIEADDQNTAMELAKPRLADARDLLVVALGDETPTVIDPITIERSEVLEGEALEHELNCRDVEPDFFDLDAPLVMQRYNKNCSRIIENGAIVALIERLETDRWAINRSGERVTPRTFASSKDAFQWWKDIHQTSNEG